MTLFDIRVTTTVNWLGALRCLRQMKRCYEQEETTSVASAPCKATMFLTERVVGSSPTGGAKKALAFAGAFFYEINPFRDL